jgi:hypothetical protein
MFNYGIFLYFLFELLLTHFRVPILHIKAFTHRSQHMKHDNTPWWVCPSNSWSEAQPNNPCRGNHLNNDQPNQDYFFRDRSIDRSINQYLFNTISIFVQYNYLGGDSVIKAWDQEICSFCGFRFEPYGCSYDDYWKLTWSLTSRPVGLIEVRAS